MAKFLDALQVPEDKKTANLHRSLACGLVSQAASSLQDYLETNSKDSKSNAETFVAQAKKEIETVKTLEGNRVVVQKQPATAPASTPTSTTPTSTTPPATTSPDANSPTPPQPDTTSPDVNSPAPPQPPDTSSPDMNPPGPPPPDNGPDTNPPVPPAPGIGVGPVPPPGVELL
jgi:hypothetical protein